MAVVRSHWGTFRCKVNMTSTTPYAPTEPFSDVEA